MKLCLNIVKIVAILIAVAAKVSGSNQPQYQVSINLQLEGQPKEIHACNGIIVHSRLILTTASCVYYKSSKNDSSVALIDPSMVSVVSGCTKFREVETKVSEIYVADDFNCTSAVNDVALLRLSAILPLDTCPDISWIPLQDLSIHPSSCMVNFYVDNSTNKESNFVLSQKMTWLSPQSCRTASEKLINNGTDICSLYDPVWVPKCYALQDHQNWNSNRGTGLVCQNKLVGLLSNIVSTQNISNNSEKPFKYYYTRVMPHIFWIFNYISVEEQKMIAEGKDVESFPYGSETKAVIEAKSTESPSLLNFTEMECFGPTKEFTKQKNAAGSSRINLKFLGSFLILYLAMLTANYG